MMFRRAVTVVMIAVLSAVLAAHGAGAQSAGVSIPGTIPEPVLSGSASLLGPLPEGAPIHLAVSLALPDPAGLAAFDAAVSTPGNPLFGHYLTQDEANARFGPTSGQEAAVISWLRENGLSVSQTYPNHLLVDATGAAAQVDAMLGITIQQYSGAVRGAARTFYAPNRAPVIPAGLAGVVQTINGLSNYPSITPRTNGKGDGMVPYYPQDFANAYNVNPLWNAGYTGAGQHVAITLWDSPPSDAVLGAFAAKTGANQATRANGRLMVIGVGNTTPPAPNGDLEAAIDVEAASGMAPGAVIDFYVAPSYSDQDLLDALNQAGTDPVDNQQISNSWGPANCGDPFDASFASASSSIYASNIATGHDYMFASGDNGSCPPDQSEYQPSEPTVTLVGGTSFTGNVGSTNPGEIAWDGSGGGYSTHYTRPTWQTGPGLDSSNERGYPDLALDGDPNTGMYACADNPGSSTPDCETLGGTSVSSPLFAGILADINQYLAAKAGAQAGFVNPAIYALFNTPKPYGAFTDITSGNDGYYSATAGWDAATGVGSPVAWNLAQDLLALQGTFVSTSGTDSGSCGAPSAPCRSVAAALQNTPAGSTILVGAGTYCEHLTISRDVTITGTSSNSSAVQLDGNPADCGASGSAGAVFTVSGAANLALRNLTVQGGSGSQGGGISDSGSGALMLTHILLRNNSASAGAALYVPSATVTIGSSTIESNTATGGGVVYLGGPATIANTTLAGNRSGSSATIETGGTLTLVNGTLTGNTASSGAGGLHVAGGTATITNSILAQNGQDCAGTVASGGGNIIGNATGCAFSATGGDAVGSASKPINPLLGALQDNGGGIPTEAVQPHSPAIGAGIGTACAQTAVVDQDARGSARFSTLRSACDTGAYDTGSLESFHPGWNLITVPLQNSGVTTASALVSGLDAAGSLGSGAVQSVTLYNNGRFQVYIPGFSSNLPLAPGAGIFVHTTAGGGWSPASGRPYTGGQPLTLQPGWNAVGAPFPAAGLTGSALDSELSGSAHCNLQEAATYHNGWIVHMVGSTAPFHVPAVSGMWLLCGQTYTWTPS